MDQFNGRIQQIFMHADIFFLPAAPLDLKLIKSCCARAPIFLRITAGCAELISIPRKVCVSKRESAFPLLVGGFTVVLCGRSDKPHSLSHGAIETNKMKPKIRQNANRRALGANSYSA